MLNCCRQYTVPGGGGCKDTQIELYGPPVSSVPLRVYTKDLQGYTSDLSCAVLQSRVFLCVNMDHFYAHTTLSAMSHPYWTEYFG